jgi:hypothetical protein
MLWVILVWLEKSLLLGVQEFSFFKTLFARETLVAMVSEFEFDLITLLIYRSKNKVKNLGNYAYY